MPPHITAVNGLELSAKTFGGAFKLFEKDINGRNDPLGQLIGHRLLELQPIVRWGRANAELNLIQPEMQVHKQSPHVGDNKFVGYPNLVILLPSTDKVRVLVGQTASAILDATEINFQ